MQDICSLTGQQEYNIAHSTHSLNVAFFDKIKAATFHCPDIYQLNEPFRYLSTARRYMKMASFSPVNRTAVHVNNLILIFCLGSEKDLPSKLGTK